VKFKFFTISLPVSIFLLILLGSIVLVVINYRSTISSFLVYKSWRKSPQANLEIGYVENREASIYYEVSGTGEPLVLLHGGLASLDVFYAQIPELSRERKVIAIDLRGQGRSSIGNSEFSYRLLAEDVVAVLDALQIESADFIGWSDGGIIGLIIGLEYPQRIRRLVSISANFRPDGLIDSVIESIQEGVAATSPFWAKLNYSFLSPHPQRWQELRERITRLWLTRPNLSLEDLQKIRSQTLLIVGENDNIELAHSRELTLGLPNAELIVLPKASHQLVMERPQKLLSIIWEFLR
jgi:pimeloyl-ACP methyl ester carboxylesterase